MNPRRVGPDINEKPKMNSFEFENFTTEQIEGNLSLYLIFNSISIFLFFIEICYKLYKIKYSDRNSQIFQRKVKKKRPDLQNEQVKPIRVRLNTS